MQQVQGVRIEKRTWTRYGKFKRLTAQNHRRKSGWRLRSTLTVGARPIRRLWPWR